MKKFITSVLIGSMVGGLCAWGFVFVAPRLSDIFADAFFYPSSNPILTVIKEAKQRFAQSPDQYIIKSVDSSIATTTKVVYADLASMNIELFENGEQVGEFPIKSIGREGTAWQTPLGKFDMSYKNRNHFSSIGHVWMPYSMHFFGNYFIHGWPYYTNGMPVAEGYSGGCIRLNTPDAENIYKFVDKNTELIVTSAPADLLSSDIFEYAINELQPTLQSKFLVTDLDTGEVVASKDQKEIIPIGSFAKLMTALISLESLNQYQETIFNQNIVPIGNILYPLLLADNSDAGQLLYEHKNKKQYLLDMNTRAESLGMSLTTYADVNGEQDTTVSTLEDTFRFLQYMYTYKPFLTQVLSLDSYKKNTIEVEALHPLQKQQDYVAGFSNDTQDELITLVKFTDGPLAQKTFSIIVHGSPTAAQDTQDLIAWLRNSVTAREGK